jgi:hypothetical protein
MKIISYYYTKMGIHVKSKLCFVCLKKSKISFTVLFPCTYLFSYNSVQKYLRQFINYALYGTITVFTKHILLPRENGYLHFYFK